ncbi:YlbF family regulator [Granulicatella seriolae]|uniref:UPF0342 protein NPA36_03740 n=1 Tax=Granulicatella seriolae TaxID=2967226 RepID=A0ABT1WM99_9LACT|nr:YlbF family regulator [Granulicatella seriolae]
MFLNIYDTANQLERELREMEQFNKVKNAFEAIEADETAKALFDEFRDVNVALQEKQYSGQEITEEEIQKAQEVGQKASEHELIQQLMQAEQQLNLVMQDINRIITLPLQELYAPK